MNCEEAIVTQKIDIVDEAALKDTEQSSRRAAWTGKNYIPLIVERLKAIKPYKIILFGSYADGEPNADSDIDLIVILDKWGIARTYKEKLQNRMMVGKQLLPIEREIPLDTLVYTRDEWVLFLSQNSSFSKLVNSAGIVLYEANNPGMAQQGQR